MFKRIIIVMCAFWLYLVVCTLVDQATGMQEVLRNMPTIARVAHDLIVGLWTIVSLFIMGVVKWSN